MGNPRYIKVAEQIKVIVAELLERRIKDPRLGDFVTVTDVRLTGDGREATVFYTVLGGEEQRAGTLAHVAVTDRAFSGNVLSLIRHERFGQSLASQLFAEELTAQLQAVLDES